EATWYLAQLEERRLQMTAALRLYRTIPIMHPRGEAAQVAFARCSEAILKRQRQLNRPAREWETAIEGWLSEATKPLLDPEATLSRTQAELLLYAARIRLTQSQPDFLKADLCLNRILNAMDDVSARDTGTQTDRTLLPDQIAMASQLRIVSLAGAGQVTEAAAILSQASNRGPEELLLLLDGLSAATAGQSETVSRELGRLQLDVLHRSGVDVATLPDAQRIPFLLRIGEASELAGRITEAAETYARLLRERPDSDSIRLNLARLRSSLPGRLDQEQATALWQTIESKNKAGSDQWLLARLEVIRCHIRLGETGIAGKLLTVTQLLYRNAGTPDIRRRYMEVEQQLAAAVRK
ncbi:MAG: tetratricopeptide repeat protein, partial [Planctomycetaceae bacterium]